MTDKTIPLPKCEMAVDWFGENVRTIHFWATNDAAAGLERFGILEDAGHTDKYRLHVDPRYDFNEVVEYIRNYG